MNISKKLYIGDDISRHRWIIWRLRKNKVVTDIYCIIYRKDRFLEIIRSHKIKDQGDGNTLIGIAATRQGALELLVRIFDDVYVPNPNVEDMKDYFIQDHS